MRRHRDAQHVARAEPGLLEHEVWKLFEVATTAFSRNPWKHHPESSPAAESWSEALGNLCKLGYLDRVRLLDASLKALGSDFSATLLSGMRDFHTSLRPTSEEVRLRQREYVRLLTSRVGGLHVHRAPAGRAGHDKA